MQMGNRRGPGGRHNNFDRPADKKKAFLRLMRYMLSFKWLLLLAFALTVLSNVFAMIGPALSGAAIDCITAEGGVDFAGVGHYAFLMLLFYLGSSVMSYLLAI